MTSRAQALEELTAPGQPFELIEVTAMGRRVRAFRHAPDSLRELYRAGRSDKTFIVYEQERISFEDAWRRACGLAHALVSEYGVAKGDRVAISMRNYPEWMIAFMAATSVGAIAVAMNALWNPAEIEYGLANAEPKVFFGDQERLDRIAECKALPAGMGVIGVRPTKPLAPGIRLFTEVGGFKDDTPAVDIAPDDDALMLFTSGSTGHPKGAVSTQRNILSALLSWELDAQVLIRRGLSPAPAPDAPQGASLLGVPLFHVAGSHAVFLASFRAQRRVICMYKWDPERAAELIEQERATVFSGPAAMTGDLVEVAKRTSRDLSTLVSVGGGGAPRAPEQVRAIESAFANARPGTAWGMTETNAIGTLIGGDEYVDRPLSSGRASAVLDIRIVDEKGAVLGPFERGEIQIRGAAIMRGYWRRPEANAETFVDDWMKTGDVAYLDEEGFLFVVDRIKDLVIRGGENIGCGAVEAALLEHPAVLEASAYGVPDERLGEELGATLYVKEAVDEAELRAFLSTRLARFEIPRYLRFETSPLPRIASGKILKRQLREEAIARLREAGQKMN